MKYVVLTGRIFFSLIFLMAVVSHFKDETIQYAVSKGVPLANILVPFSAVLAFMGGLSIVLGYKARMGAWLIVAFLVPVTLMMHAFWKETDPMQTQMQMANFMKNLSLLGAALMISYFGTGPLSIDNRSDGSLNKELIKKSGTSYAEPELKDIRYEDTREKIKMELADYDIQLDHFWQKADNPGEVVFLFTSGNLSRAKEFIKRKSGRKNLPQTIFYKKEFIYNQNVGP